MSEREPDESTGRPTILEVAAACGVSPATVSNVLANKRYVKAETRLLVQHKVAELGYRASQTARSLRMGRSWSIGLVIGDIANPYVAEIVRGVEEVAWAKRNSLILCNTNFDADKKMAYVRSLLDQRVEGLILVSQTFSADEARALNLAGVPVVTVNRNCPSITADQVCIDNAGGIRSVMQYLVQLGHRRIAFVKGAASTPADERHAAYLESLRKHRLDDDPGLVVQGDYSMESGSLAARELFARGAAPTAVVAANDLMAIGMLGALREMSLDVPGDISVVGFDDIFFSSHPLVRLTTVNYPKREMGATAARLLLRRIAEGRSDPARSVVVDSSLIVRGTAGPARAPADANTRTGRRAAPAPRNPRRTSRQ